MGRFGWVSVLLITENGWTSVAFIARRTVDVERMGRASVSELLPQTCFLKPRREYQGVLCFFARRAVAVGRMVEGICS